MKDKEINIQVDINSKTPIYDQIKQEIKLLIASGNLIEDEKMPSIRDLAAKLQINHNTIVKVYYQLDMEGFLYSQKGKGYFVKKNTEDVSLEKNKMLEELTNEYLEKVSKLGCSVKDLIKYLKNK